MNTLTESGKKQKVQELTSFLMHRFYCDNEVEPVIDLFDDLFSWFGTGEEEYAIGKDKVAELFRQFIPHIMKCNITEEEYEVLSLGGDVFVCTGRMWITTDSSTDVYLQTHQRITAVFRFIGQKASCCHIHISNPYMEMTKDDIGFPTATAHQTKEYMKKVFREQQEINKAREEKLLRISYEDSMTGVYNRNRFNKDSNSDFIRKAGSVGIACYDINGLKEMNDSYGHGAGDNLVRRVAEHIRKYFRDKTYRIGGDEFMVVDTESDRDTFFTKVEEIQTNMSKEQISCSVGFCWKDGEAELQQMLDEADRLMYEDKKKHYEVMGKWTNAAKEKEKHGNNR